MGEGRGHGLPDPPFNGGSGRPWPPSGGGGGGAPAPLPRNIALQLAYDGTDFSGWERQAGPVRTVQGVLEAALAALHKGPVAVTGSGRTDAGVHAAGQVANFRTTIGRMEAWRFKPALNQLLPPDVRVRAAWEAAPDFHARFDARSRTYRYRLVAGRDALPWERRYAWPLRRYPRVDLLNAYAAHLRGELDCGLFAVPGDQSRSRSRCFRGAGFFVEGGVLVFEVRANAFLWKMVRSLVGTLLHYEARGLPVEAFDEALASGDRRRAGPTAPAEGLTLWEVGY